MARPVIARSEAFIEYKGFNPRHCEERSDKAIQKEEKNKKRWIASPINVSQ